MRRRGFTLIELLVVIAIIAILAAILFPVFARARAKAQQATCLSNVKQLSLSVLMYASDNDQVLPRNNYLAGAPWNRYVAWHEMVHPYVKNMQIYMCPVDPVSTGSAQYNGLYASYGHNNNGSLAYDWTTLAVKMNLLEYPAERLLIAEANSNYLYHLTCEQRVMDWHQEGANISYTDGHAKWIKQAAVRQFVWATAFPTDAAGIAAKHFWNGVD